MNKNDLSFHKSKEFKTQNENIYKNSFSIINSLLEKYKPSKNLRLIDNSNSMTDHKRVA
tara:strand:- start:183 stop:359 length:177 start_codon:yes stop_codon:yes gene_type:complete